MSQNFNVEILSFEKITQIENAWQAEDYKALLSLMGLEDELESINTKELEEMCLLSLTDHEPHEAAKIVLSYLFEGRLTEGKMDQVSHKMLEDRLWEEFADLSYHNDFFNAYELLRRAFNGIFTQPIGVCIHIKISINNTEALALFDDSAKPLMVRLLVAGMEENVILNRLYSEQIQGDQFEEAENIIWHLTEKHRTENTIEYEIVSSEFWFGELEEVEHYEATAHADVSETEAS
ncbi:hypothetical protein KKC13_12740 [bacterium]|nr:hypothetical protein [bacterium]MBU1959210.1 hypothetical protein [bacterium]